MRSPYLRLTLFFITLTFCCKDERLEFREMPLGGDAELTSEDGQREKISQSFKPATLLFFGFTRCPDFCPMTLHKIDSALRGDPALRDRTRLIFISVDSLNERPENLKKFLAPFPYARGYTGSKTEIAELEKKFGAYSKTETKTLSHSLYIYVLNPAGRVQYLLRHDDPTEKILAAIRQAAG